MKVILSNLVPDGPVCCPDSSVISDGMPYFFPEGAGSITVRLWAGAVISRLGKGISARFAPRYYSRIVMGTLNMEDGDALTANLMRDGAVCIGKDIEAGATVYIGETALRLPGAETFDRLINETSLLATLKTGDIIGLILDGQTGLEHGVRHDIYAKNSGDDTVLHAKYR